MEVKGDLEQEKIIDSLQTWFEENDKLPNKIDRVLLTRFYYCMQKDVEKTQKLLETNYSMRFDNAYIFADRDPTDEDTENTLAFADIIPLPGLTPQSYRVMIHRINSSDPKMIHHAQDTKTYMLLADTRFSLPDAVIDGVPVLAKGDVHVTDMACHTMGHMRQMSFRVLRAMVKFLQEAYPIRIRAIHLINCPSYMNKIMSIIRPFVNKRVFEVMHFHTDGLDGLYEHIPKEMLPEEYGGNAGTIPELKKKVVATMMEKRDYLMDPDYWSR
ncbi:alpha-tocopherol transfer protein-like [Stomoxys calcitrans]|uniref:CRAL-TRIO domain-containing protein n=1 Tax=Stomoxys calcitrans TaxID=35570 RepID=A0A1I8Q9A5_STOCA|nr:alpha-tocopherol transfer protein-like [Stomoxys calcitrans]